MAFASQLGATAIIIVHNHPSGDAAPPARHKDDEGADRAGRHMRVTVHDYVIVGSQGRKNMKTKGLI